MLLYQTVDLVRYGVQEKMEKQPDSISEGSKEGGHDGKLCFPVLLDDAYISFNQKASTVETVCWSS